MAIERFEEIVEAAKEQEIEIAELKEALKKAKNAVVRKVKSMPGKCVAHEYPDEVADHRDETEGFYAITKREGSDKFEVIIHHISPVTGRDTTAGGAADSLVEAVILRNERAAELIREGLIDFERYLKIVRG